MAELTLKQKRFVTEYIRTGNASQAVRAAGYNTTDVQTITSIAYENLRKPDIHKAVTKALTKQELTPDWVLDQIRSIVNEAPKHQDKLRALELIGKHLQMFGTQDQTNHYTAITIALGNDKGLAKPIDSTLVE